MWGIALLPSLLLGAPAAPSEIRARLAAAAEKLSVFETSDWLYNRWPSYPGVQPDYRAVLEPLRDANWPAADLLPLLQDANPKIRTLAIALLYAREDPQLLPRILPLARDTAPTFPRRRLEAFTIARPPAVHTDPQTVGDFVRQILAFYLEPAGYSFGRNPGWEQYWQTHQGRAYCLSWLRVSRNRITGGTSPLQPGAVAPLRQFYERLASLPAPDGDLYLLWFEANPNERTVVTDAELLAAARRLGHDRVMQIVNGVPPSDDPDLLAEHCQSWVYRGVVDFLLLHARELFRPEDDAVLAGLLARERTRSRGGSSSAVVTPFYAIARAQLAPAQSSTILRAAFSEFPDNSTDFDQAHLAGALWQLRGAAEMPFLADWFLRKDGQTNGDQAQSVFLSYLHPSDCAFAEGLLRSPAAAALKGKTVAGLCERFPAVERGAVLDWFYAQKAPARWEEPGKEGFIESVADSRNHSPLRWIVEDSRFDRLPLWFLRALEQAVRRSYDLPSETNPAFLAASLDRVHDSPADSRTAAAGRFRAALRAALPFMTEAPTSPR